MIRPGSLAGLGVGQPGEMRLGNWQRSEPQRVGPAAFSLPGIDGGTEGQTVGEQGGFVADGVAGDAAAAVRSVP